MKKGESFFSLSEQQQIKEDEIHKYSYGVTNRLLEKYKPAKGLVTTKGMSQRSKKTNSL